LKKSLTPIPLSSLANLQSKFKDDIFEVNPFVTSSDPIKKSKHVFISHSPERDSIYSHRLKHFNSNEELVASIKVTDNAIYFQEDDEIIIGTHAIYWYMSRVGQYYSKSNGEFDAEHQSEEHILIASETATWKTVCEQEICYLELQQKNGHFFRSTGIKLSEVEALIALQKQLNTLNSETS
jgi:hypothetical protein